MTSHPALAKWIDKMTALCQPAQVEWCDGSQEEWNRLTQLLVDNRTLTRLNPEKRPNSFLARSSPGDVARVEDRTFICTRREVQAGPTNNWAEAREMLAKMHDKFTGCMEGRTMYVIPFCMGPPSSPLAKIGVQITDSAYVVVNMRIMAHMGAHILKQLEEEQAGTAPQVRHGHAMFIPCAHTSGMPLTEGVEDIPWPCNDDKYLSLIHI